MDYKWLILTGVFLFCIGLSAAAFDSLTTMDTEIARLERAYIDDKILIEEPMKEGSCTTPKNIDGSLNLVCYPRIEEWDCQASNGQGSYECNRDRCLAVAQLSGADPKTAQEKCGNAFDTYVYEAAAVVKPVILNNTRVIDTKIVDAIKEEPGEVLP